MSAFRRLPDLQREWIGARRPNGRSNRRQRTSPVRPVNNDQPIRADLVRRVRGEILAGTYDTSEKLEAALDRLAERFTSD